jgi:transcriptional regulator
MTIWQQKMFSNDAAVLDLVKEIGFASLITFGKYKNISHTPYEHKGLTSFRFHLANKNPQVNDLIESGQATLVIVGSHGYVTPKWYSRDQQVPTWDFETVHLFGKVTKLSEENLIKHLDALVDLNETQIKSDFCMADLNDKTIANNVRAITGFELIVEEVSSKFKMSQDKKSGMKEIIAGLTKLGKNKLAAKIQKYSD